MTHVHNLAAIATSERRRRSTRHTCNLRASYARLLRPDLAKLPGTVKNISRGGVCMQVGTPLDVGTMLTVRIYSLSGRRVLARPAQVRNLRPGPGGTWLVGLAFG